MHPYLLNAIKDVIVSNCCSKLKLDYSENSVCIILSKGPRVRAILKAMLLITRDCGREMFFY